MPVKSVLDALIQHADVAVTEPSADAFDSADIQTGISTAANYGWMIHSVEFTFGTLMTGVPPTVDADVTLQLVQGSGHTATVSFIDDDLIYGMNLFFLGTAADTTSRILLGTYTWMAPPNLVVVDPTLQLLIDSTATALSLTASCRVFYQPVELSELDILRLIALR